MIRYDILFQAYAPKEGSKDEYIGLMINVEAQNTDNLIYHLPKRCVYYDCRIVAGQKNAPGGFEKSKFDDLNKSYSIWICLNHSKKLDNVIDHYYLVKERNGQLCEEPEKDYDLIHVVIIYPAKTYDYENKEQSLQKLMNILFQSQMPAEEKKQYLREYRIKLTRTIEEEVENMCNFSQGVLEEGIMEGRKEGLIEGKRRGRKEGKITGIMECAKNMIKKNHMEVNETLEMLGVDETLRPKILEILKKEGIK